VDKKLALKELLQRKKMGSRGIINDKWSMRILWGCAIGSAIGMIDPSFPHFHLRDYGFCYSNSWAFCLYGTLSL